MTSTARAEEGVPAPWEIPHMDAAQLAFQLGHRPINQERPFKILCIGAGLSGIYGEQRGRQARGADADSSMDEAGIRIPRSLPGVELVIVDKNAECVHAGAER